MVSLSSTASLSLPLLSSDLSINHWDHVSGCYILKALLPYREQSERKRASNEWPLLFPWADNDATKINKGGNACVCGWEFQWALHPSVFFHSSPCFCCWLSDASSQHGDDGRHSMSPPNGHQLSSDAFFVYHHLNIWPLMDAWSVSMVGRAMVSIIQ
jgi:hypothetical protein